MDNNLCPPIIRDELVIHTCFNPRIVQHALENWETSYNRLKQEGKNGPFYYIPEVYERLGL